MTENTQETTSYMGPVSEEEAEGLGVTEDTQEGGADEGQGN